MNDVLLETRGLTQCFSPNRHTVIRAVDNVSFTLRRGEILGLVGESGSGKTTLGKSIAGIYRPTGGEIYYAGQAVGGSNASRHHKKALHRHIQMIFQDVAGSVNPRMTVGEIVAEPLRIHFPLLPAHERECRVQALLEQAGLEAACLHEYPQALSGGQLQRVCIARALALEPECLIADEPVSSLDVSMQAQIINLFLRLQSERGLTCLFISHGLPVVRRLCDRVGVLYRGKLVELAETEELCQSPLHPYTRALLSGAPTEPTPAPELPLLWREALPGHFVLQPVL